VYEQCRGRACMSDMSNVEDVIEAEGMLDCGAHNTTAECEAALA
jgi:hypothetical protein